MMHPISENEARKHGIYAKPLKIEVQYTYLRDARLKPTIDCWTPPVGWVYDYVEEKWIKTGVHKRAHRKEDCYWEIDPRFKLYKQWKKDEEKKQLTNPDYKHPELQQFIKDCWRNRLSGFWFSNNGEPTYVTGQHWFYLSVFKLDIGLPKYREVDRDVFYVWEYVHTSETSYGLILLTKRRNGKCFGKDTMIRMYDGTVKAVQDIKEGEFVMGDDSTPRLVYGVTSGREEMFKIIPSFGEPFTCNKSHILTMKWNGVDSKKNGWVKDQTVNMTVEEYLNRKDWERDHLVMYRAGWDAQKENKEHFIDPYLLGVYLGDGCQVNGHISIADREIEDYVKGFCSKHELELKHISDYDYAIRKERGNTFKVSIEQDGKEIVFDSVRELKKHLGISEECKLTPNQKEFYKYKVLSAQNNVYMDELRRLNLIQNKHIPDEYLIDGRENRLQLLAGLLDTDGYAARNKKSSQVQNYEIVQKNKHLAYQIADLARSLGFYTKVFEKEARMKREDGSVYKCLVYRLNICGKIEQIPLRVERKKCHTTEGRRVNICRTGFKIESLGEGDYYGFAVDNNNLFLLHDGIVVHNTYIGGSLAVEQTSRQQKFRSGIQSKNDDDAKKVFVEHVFYPFKSIPYFLKPEKMDLPKGGKAPATGLKFNSGSVDDDSDEEGEELQSIIDFRPSGIFAYDGYKMKYYFADEIGKTTLTDVYERWGTAKKCLVDDDDNIIGKSFQSTTVEDMEMGGANFMRLWKDSDQGNMVHGQTVSGLYKIFIPAFKTRAIDVYGKCDEEANKLYFIQKRERLANNPRALSKEKRQNPFYEEEAFSTDSTKCVFNPITIDDRIEELTWLPEQFERGNLHWKDGHRFGEVIFVKNPNGKFCIAEHPPENRRNMVQKRGKNYFPYNTESYCGGVDTYDHKQISKGGEYQMSLGSITILKKEDPINPSPFDKAPVLFYLWRPDNPKVFYEDVIMSAWYYGCMVLVETNKPGCLNEMEEYGCETFVPFLPGKSTRGIATTLTTNNLVFDLTDQSIGEETELEDGTVRKWISKVNFLPLLHQWKEFTPEDTTAYDGAMSFGLAKILEKNTISRRTDNPEQKEDVENLLSFMRRKNFRANMM